MENIGPPISTTQTKQRWWVLACVAWTYLLAFTQRTGPGVISNQLQAQFHVSAAVLGTTASIQFLLYMLLQIPVGLSGDRFGPERLLVAGALLDGVGTLIFAHAPSFAWLLVGRAVVGFGDALLWVNIVLILANRFLPREFAALLGVVSIAGNLGALFTTLPFAAWIAVAGWQGPFSSIGVILLLTAVVDYVSLFGWGLPRRKAAVQAQTRPGHSDTQTAIAKTSWRHSQARKNLAVVVRNRVAWATFGCHFGAVGTYLGFFGLWAVPYFMATYHLSRSGATWFTLTAFVGALIGAPITGAVSDKLGKRRAPYLILQIAATLMWAVIPLAGGNPPIWLAITSMFIIGFESGGSLLTFAVIRDQIPLERGGVTSGFANTGGFLSAVLLPVLFGAVIDYFQPGSVHGAAPSPHAFAMAFLVPVLFSFIGVVGSYLIQEKPAAFSGASGRAVTVGNSQS